MVDAIFLYHQKKRSVKLDKVTEERLKITSRYARKLILGSLGTSLLHCLDHLAVNSRPYLDYDEVSNKVHANITIMCGLLIHTFFLPSFLLISFYFLYFFKYFLFICVFVIFKNCLKIYLYHVSSIKYVSNLAGYIQNVKCLKWFLCTLTTQELTPRLTKLFL